MKRLKLLVAFFSFCLAFSQSDKQLSFHQLTLDDGLSQNSVVSIAQDGTGFMWFATQDGLNRYDGKRFEYFQHQFEDVTRNDFSKLGKIFVDRQGTLWLITSSGVLQKQINSSYTFKKLENITNSSTLFQSTNNAIFIGTYGSGLYRIDVKNKDTVQILKQEHKNLNSYDFVQYKNKVLASTSNGVLEIDQDNTYTFKAISETTNFSAFAKTSKALFLGSYGKGLFYKDSLGSEFKPFLGFENFSLPNDLNIQDVLADSSGQLWVATYGKGVYLINFDQQVIQHFVANKTNPYALHYNDVLSLYEDFTGTVWLGTDGAGLSFYDKDLTKFNVLTENQVPSNIHIDVIRAITVHNGVIWIGTSGEGLTSIDLKTQQYKTLTAENSGLLGNRIMSLQQDATGIWIGHQDHGLQFMDNSGKVTSHNDTKAFTIWKLLPASNDKLWLCTRNHGLILFDKEKGVETVYNSENSNLTTNNIRTVEKGANGNLWIGTEQDGLFVLNQNTKVIKAIDEIPDKIKSLFFSDGILWIGTNGNGLKGYTTSTGEILQKTIDDGLPNNVIYGILPGNKNELWLSSNKGITKIDKTNFNIDNYSNYEGLQAFEFNTGAYYKDEKGTLYFGGLQGLNWFNPNQLTYNTVKPKTVITNFEIFAKSHEMEQNQVFSSDQNTMTFTFSSLHFSQPDRNQYKYQLVNHDPDWISSGNNNTAHYTNLSPGNYTFKVISSNYDGVWNENATTYSFTIRNPWYLSTLALLCYVLLVIVIALGIYRYLKWRWQMKMQLDFEHQETQRLKKLDELKTRLYTNISHEFRTPLTLITGPIENQLAKQDISLQDKKELTMVKTSSERLLDLVNQMLELAKVDSGHIKLKVKKGNLSLFLKQLLETFHYKAQEKNLQLVVSINKLDEAWFDRDIVEKVVSNLLSNAIKYAPEASVIQFDAIKNNHVLVLSVSNETHSETLNNLGKLFKRFYQDNELSDGVGVGLALVKELVNLNRGTILASSAGTNKIQFTLTLPIERDVFDTDEIVEEYPIQDIVNQQLKNGSVRSENTILIVEDSEEILQYIVSLFQDSYTIHTARNGEKGLKEVENKLPDLVLSDIMMPIKDGMELCHQIKTNRLTSHIPVVLLTAKVGEENEIQGYKTGADAYVTKPFSSEKLKLIVDQLIQTRKKLKEHYSKTFSIHPELAITSTENDFLKKLQEVLEKHITDASFTSEKFSKLMFMSRSQLHRKLEAIVGMSTSEFIRSQRLKMAADLLTKSDSSMAEIAYQVGFNTASYFNKCFKDVYGCTPSEYLNTSG